MAPEMSGFFNWLQLTQNFQIKRAQIIIWMTDVGDKGLAQVILTALSISSWCIFIIAIFSLCLLSWSLVLKLLLRRLLTDVPFWLSLRSAFRFAEVYFASAASRSFLNDFSDLSEVWMYSFRTAVSAKNWVRFDLRV